MKNISYAFFIYEPGKFAGVVRRVESLLGRMSEAGRQVEGLFESLLAEAFNEP